MPALDPSARVFRALALVSVVASLTVLTPTPTRAGHRTVTNTNDSLAGSLRQAVLDSTPGDSIIFDPAVWGATITLSSGSVAITHTLTIAGPQKSLVTLAGSAGDRLFSVSSGNLSLGGLTLTNPGASTVGLGGLIQTSTSSASLVLTDCDLVKSGAVQGGGFVYATGPLTAVRCRLSGGTTPSGAGGAVYARGKFTATDCLFDSSAADTGGAIASEAQLRLVRCTLTGNQANAGAAIAVLPAADSTSLLECTIASNPGSGAAVLSAGTLPVDTGNTVIAADTGGDVSGAFHSLGFNAIGVGTGSTGFGGAGLNDQVGTGGTPLNPKLALLLDNGGPTLTLAPMSASSLVDHGHAMIGPVDARGHARTYDQLSVPNGTGSDGTDVGAVELTAKTQFPVTNLLDHGAGSLRQAAITAATGDSVTFDPSVGGTIQLTSGEVRLLRGIYLLGPGPNVLILDGGGVRPALATIGAGGLSVRGLSLVHGGRTAGLDVGAGTSTTFDLMVISDCQTSGVRNAGALVLKRSLVTRCNAAAPAPNQETNGGAVYNTGSLVVVSSTLTADTAFAGGAISSLNGTVEVDNSTVANNVTVGGTPSTRQGGGIQGGLLAYLTSSIVAGNKGDLGGPDLLGHFITNGFNLVGVGDGSTGLANGTQSDQVGSLASPILAKLGPLADNGGPSLTMLPLAGSPAIDQGKANGATTDQRERARIFDDGAVPNATNGDGTDVGACERDAAFVDAGPPPGTIAGVGVDRIDAILPNPSASAWTVRFTLARAGAVDLALFDVAGRRVATVARGPLAAGPHELPAPAAARDRLPAGVYWLRLVGPTGTVSRGLVRVR